jgi:2-hydroxy-3-keto-5-methylthiopentenyl-1-phosphate phosphatase
MVRVFCDFDGTVCPQDIGEEFFRAFADDTVQQIVDELLQGKINSQQWLRRACDAVPLITRAQFDAYIDLFAADPFFAQFVHFVEAQGAAVSVVSDGLDAYVTSILFKAGLQHVPVFANHAEFVNLNGIARLAVSFPHTDAECAVCGNCKRNHILAQAADDDVIVYAGDGFSDRCPVRYADIVFAKRHLIKHCRQQNITYYEFNHFDDVQKKMEEIFHRKRIRRRQEASMARREAYMQG